MAEPAGRDQRTLYVLRHAKSDWGDPGLDDRDRPLAARGRRAAPAVADYLRARHRPPAVVLCSPARRTLQTLELLGGAVGGAEIVVDEQLYGASAQSLLDRLRTLPPDVDPVLLVGHNPAVQQLVGGLAASGPGREELARKYPTAAMAVLTVAAPWPDVDWGAGVLVDAVTPRRLGVR